MSSDSLKAKRKNRSPFTVLNSIDEEIYSLKRTPNPHANEPDQHDSSQDGASLKKDENVNTQTKTVESSSETLITGKRPDSKFSEKQISIDEKPNPNNFPASKIQDELFQNNVDHNLKSPGQSPDILKSNMTKQNQNVINTESIQNQKAINTESKTALDETIQLQNVENKVQECVIETQSNFSKRDGDLETEPKEIRNQYVIKSKSIRNHNKIQSLVDRNSDYVIGTESIRDQSETLVNNDNESVINTKSIRNQNVIKKESSTESSTESDYVIIKPRSLDRRDDLLFNISSLEKRILDFLFDICLINNSNHTSKIKYRVIAESCQTTEKTAKTTCQRMIKKQFLNRRFSSKGPGAATVFEIPESIIQALIAEARKVTSNERKSTEIRNQSVINKESNAQSNTESTPSSKLVSNINTNLLGEEAKEALPEFLNVDISGLVSCGVYKKHLMDLHNQKQSFEKNQMEDFIWKFREYVSDSERVRGVRSIPALFVTLARQLASGYDPLESIQTPEQKLLEGLIERNKKALMELKSQKEESKSLEFEIWFEKLNRQERDELAPPNSIVESGSELQKRSLMGYFDNAIWNG